MEIIGRKREMAIMEDRCRSGQAQFWAIYGRRRIGKTFLVREFFQKRESVCCFVTGQNGKPMKHQLAHFLSALERAFFEGERLAAPKNWDEAFAIMLAGIRLQTKKSPDKEVVLFLDELPWLATRKSGILNALDHIWNTELQYIPQVRLVICGSAASWMIENVILSKGGLHNRLTATFPLLPFTLAETLSYLRSYKSASHNEAQVLELYMATGGVPYYLSFVKAEYSAAQNIGYLFFGGGALANEFDKLFSSLFEKSENHLKIVKALAARPQGLIRTEIVNLTKMPAGRTATVAIKELEEAGFIGRFRPVDRFKREEIFRLTDEFCIFYAKWIALAPSKTLVSSGIDYWLRQSQTQGFTSWAGLAFEAICLKHVSLIVKKLGFSAVNYKVGPWARVPGRGGGSSVQGAQIDLLFERADRVTTIAEMKYYNDSFSLTKSYKDELQKKVEVYRQVTKSKNHVSLALVAPYGIRHNEQSLGFITEVVTLQSLFDEAER